MWSFIDFSIPQVQAAVINGCFSIITTGVFGLIGILISKKFRKDAEKVQKLESKLQKAIDDIHFLLKVEELHCENNRENLGRPNKNKIRETVRNIGLQWSGKFTPGKVNNPEYND